MEKVIKDVCGKFMLNWHLEKRKISALKPHKNNPRTLTTDQAAHLTVSLEKFGLADKPIINLDDTIIGGHQRIRVLKKLKYKEIECWVPDRMLEEKEVDELLIRLNRNHGDFDFDTLANNFEALELLEWGFQEDELVGFDTDEKDEKSKTKNKKVQICPHCGEEFS